jgi:serine/threonine protein kinase/Flp pilus assembly protein TadD
MLGEVITHYRVFRKLGGGGMGVVYEAEDLQLGRHVALKFLPDALESDPQALQRFQREARAASALNHPNICTIYEIGTDGRRHFIAMEVLDGETLKYRISGHPGQVDEILEWGIQIADALDAAHSKGIVHRDIKPANLFITSRDKAKVLDFGLAKIRPTAVSAAMPTMSAEEPITELGSAVGTVAYMSPEQALGRELDARTDIFSLGVVLYEMATGRAPFQGKTSAAIFDAILHAAPTSPVRLNPELPPALESIINKCLEKDCELRYQSAEELRSDLKRLKRDTDGHSLSQTALRPKTRPSEARSKIRRIAAGVLALVAIAGALWWYGHRSNRIESMAVLPFENVGGNGNTEYLSDGLTEELIDSLSGIPKLQVTARGSVFRFKSRNVDPQTAGKELHVQAVLLGRVFAHNDTLEISAELMDVASNNHLWGAHYTRKQDDVLGLQRDLAKDVSNKLRPKLTDTQDAKIANRGTEVSEAYQLYLKGEFEFNKRSQESFDKAVEYYQAALQKDSAFARAYAGLAQTHFFQGSWFGVSGAGAKARIAANRALELDDSLIEAHLASGNLKAQYDWDWTGAEHEFTKAIRDDPNSADAHFYYGRFLALVGDLDNALGELQRAHALDPLSPPIAAHIAIVHTGMGRNDDAIREARAVLQTEPNFIPAMTALLEAYERKGMYEDEYDMDRQYAGNNRLNWLQHSAHTHALMGNSSLARKEFAEAQILADQQHTPISPAGLAWLYSALGQKDKAFTYLEQACADHDDPAFIFDLSTMATYDRLKTDSRWAALMLKMNLPSVKSHSKTSPH